MYKIGEKLYNLRKQNGISQEELAELIGVSRQSIHKWETDKVLPTKENILALSVALNVKEEYFYKDFEEIYSAEIQSEVAVAKSKKVRLSLVIFLILVTVCFLCAMVETLRIGFLAFTSNNGALPNNTLFFEVKNLFFVLLFLSCVLIALDIILAVILAKKSKD